MTRKKDTENGRAGTAGTASARRAGATELQELLYHNAQEMARLADMLKTAMTAGLEDATDLIGSGVIELTGGIAIVDRRELPKWKVTLEGVLLLHLYEPDWFHAWQFARRNRN